MLNGEDKAKRWRPWRFSLRSLLSLMLLVATFFGGWKANDWYRDRDPKRSNHFLRIMYEMDHAAQSARHQTEATSLNGQ